jgi:hypothetical protein
MENLHLTSIKAHATQSFSPFSHSGMLFFLFFSIEQWKITITARHLSYSEPTPKVQNLFSGPFYD